MHILQINIINNNYKLNKTYAIGAKPVTYSRLNVQPQLCTDTVSFGRIAKNARPLRELMKEGLCDIWTGRPVISIDTFEKILRKKEFNKSIKSILKVIDPLKDTLHKVPLEIYGMLQDYAKINPKAHLDEIFQNWAPLAQRELDKIQRPVFKKLIEEARFLPSSQKEEFYKFMTTTQEQIQQKPIVQSFNKRDFRYKLERIAQKIRQRNITEEVSAINKIIKYTEKIPETKTKNGTASKQSKKQNQQIQIEIIKNMQSFYERSVLSGDKELRDLFTDINRQIQGIATFIPFGRINFIEGIKEIVKNIPDKNVAKKLIQIAAEIPTANQETSAFIIKASRKPSEKIGYDLLWGSVGNIDHLNAYSRGGRDGLSNYAVSTNYTNSERHNKIFAEQLRNRPEAYFGCQVYIDKLIEFYNKGRLKKLGLNKPYILNLVKKLEHLSPAEKPLKLDISKLQ